MPKKKNLKCSLDHQLIDAKIGIIEERISGHWTLDDERWRAHDRLHIELARALSEYKTQANEWRTTLNDLRLNLVTKAEYEAKHESLRSELVSELRPIDAKVDTAREWQTARDARERGVTNTLSVQRTLLLVVGSIVGTIIGIASLVDLFSTFHPGT